jgi:hypothetical protein
MTLIEQLDDRIEVLTIGTCASVAVAGATIGSDSGAAAVFAVADGGPAVAGRNAAALLEGARDGLRGGHGGEGEGEGEEGQDVL